MSVARPGSPSVAGPRQITSNGCALVNFTSTVDAFPLSYFECLPTGFSNASGYPLAIFLHGLNETATTPLDGGYLTQFNASWVPIAAAWGYILIVVNTRTGTGFYINSPYTGPQEQDVWDAIHSEESRRAITSLYLFGSSMGTMGTFEIAGETPSAFKGIGAVLSFSDYFEEYDYLTSIHGGQFTAGILAAIDNGSLPNQSATARSMWLALSGPRFDPENFSGLRQYLVHGGQDLESPNNPTVWPYQQANDTILNRTCQVRVDLAEPANCTHPLTVLHALQPSLYAFRYVFEPTGVHTTDELNLSDMFAFWDGQVGSGVYWSGTGGTPAAPPVDTVNFATVPAGCGLLTFRGQPYTWGQLATVPNGTYPVNATPCPGDRLAALVVDGNATFDGATSSVTVQGTTIIVATFRPITPPPPPNVTFYAQPSTCGPLVVNGSNVPNGGVLALVNGSYPVLAGACSAETFSAWSATGSVHVATATSAATTLTVAGNGTLTAEYTAVVVPPPPPHFLVNITVQPDPCGAGLTLGGALYPNGSVANLTAGNYSLSAPLCAGYSFLSWNLTGSLGLLNGSSLDVDGNGSLAALLTQNQTPPGHKSGPPSGNNSSGAGGGAPWPILPFALLAGVVAVVGVVVYATRGRRARPEASEDVPTD